MTEQEKIDWYLSLHYPIKIFYIVEGSGKDYYYAYLTDFGPSMCSATGDTISEAIYTLNKVKNEIITFMVKSGRLIPKPEKPPFFNIGDN